MIARTDPPPRAHGQARPDPRVAGAAAVLFDLDGVITPTALVHERAWAVTMRRVLAELGSPNPYTADDYFQHLDGRPRYDGIDALLRSRGIEQPWGAPTDPPSAPTVCGIGNRKQEVFAELLATEGVAAYPGSVALIDALRRAGVPLAIVSSSRNARPVLAAAGLLDRFAVIVDGETAASRGLPGKPAPDTFLDAARQLGAPPARTVVVEDAASGVRAGVAGGFRLVIGVDRGAGRAALAAAGAGIIVDDLDELVTGGEA